MAAIEEKQRKTAEWLVSQVVKARPDKNAVWNLAGAVGAGKSAVLRLVRESLETRSIFPILITAPAGEVDAAAIALLETAQQLQDAHLMNGQMALVNDPKRGWGEKLSAVTAVINAYPGTVVILCDEPIGWYRNEQSLLDDTPDYWGRAFAEWIARDAPCRRIIAGAIPGGMTAPQTRAPRLDDGRAFLAEFSHWGQAASLAVELAPNLPGPIEHRSLWEMKLCVALARHMSGTEVVKRITAGVPAEKLIEELFDLLQANHSFHVVCGALARLAAARTAIDAQAFNDLTGDVQAIDHDLMYSCLGEGGHEGFSLHPFVRHQVLARLCDPRRMHANAPWKLNPTDRVSMHGRLAAYYSSKTPSDARSALESFHHELIGGGGGFQEGDSRLRFVEQIQEVGRIVSYALHDHRRAVDLFRLALRFDPNQAYSHHYLAYNLDWLAEDQETVEDSYRKAIELQPTHPWWWSRWISYLATRGRFADAKAAWLDAVDSLSVNEEESPAWIYLSLHRWVARWLLHWGEIDFAEQVLQSIPNEISGADASIQALWDLLRALRFAQDEVAVFPLTVPQPQWWTKLHTDLPLISQNANIRQWRPARVTSVDSKKARLRLICAVPPEQAAEPLRYEELSLSKQEVESAAHGFKWEDLAEGRFIELAYYGDDKALRIGLHRETELRDPRLLPLVPPPDRWYRQAVKAAWVSQGEAR